MPPAAAAVLTASQTTIARRTNWCLTNACIAGTVADPNMVKEMASGQTLRLEFVDSSLLTLTTSLPLGLFASAHKGAPAQTFEQDIDE